jgi:hypothetical protein
MKKIFLFLMLFVIYTAAIYSQSNNPYNNIGVNVTNAIVTLTNDYKKGKLSDYNQATISRYKSQFGIDTNIPENLVSSIYTTVTNANFNYVTTINNSSVSQYVKTKTLEIINITKTGTPESQRNNIVSVVEDIKASNNVEGDKQILLTTCASIYNVSISTDEAITTGMNRNEEGAVWGTIIGMAIGGIIGAPFCGAPCSFIGSIVVGFIGNLVGGAS